MREIIVSIICFTFENLFIDLEGFGTQRRQYGHYQNLHILDVYIL